MSISSQNMDPEDEKFADVVYTGSNEAPAEAPKETEEREKTANETTEEKPVAKERRKKGGIFDAVLLLALLGCIGGGAYFVYSKMDEFKIPSPLEEEIAAQEALQQQIEKQNEQNTKAQITQRLTLKSENTTASQQLEDKTKQLADAEKAIAQLEQECKDAEASLNTAKEDYAKLDKAQRAEIMKMLTGEGVAIGPITTIDGEKIQNATLRKECKKEGNRWRISGNNNCYDRPIEFKKYHKQFPLIVHYARGRKDLITRGALTEQTAEEIAAEREELAREAVEQARNYDPLMAPTVVTQSSETTDIVEDDTTEATEETEFDVSFEQDAPADNEATHTMPDEQLPW